MFHPSRIIQPIKITYTATKKENLFQYYTSDYYIVFISNFLQKCINISLMKNKQTEKKYLETFLCSNFNQTPDA